MDSSRPTEAPGLTPDAIEFVRFCYRRRRVGWPELYDEMCAVAGRGLYRGWRFAELEEHGIGFSLHQTLELARIAGQVAVEEGDRRGRSGRTAARAAGRPAGAPVEPTVHGTDSTELVVDVPVVEVSMVGAPVSLTVSRAEQVIDVPIIARPEGGPTEPPPPEPSTPSRPALAPSMIRSAAGAN